MAQTTVRGLGARAPAAARRQLRVLNAVAAPPGPRPAAQGPPAPAQDSLTPASPAQLLALQQQAGQQQQQPAASSSGRVVLEAPEELRSTLEHRLWVGGCSALLAGLLANGLAEVHDAGSAAAMAGAALAAYVAADFGSAVFHWAGGAAAGPPFPFVGTARRSRGHCAELRWT